MQPPIVNKRESSNDLNMTKSVKVDRAMLPEIANQHKSKEMTKTDADYRGVSNSSMVNRANATDFSMSYLKEVVNHRDSSGNQKLMPRNNR